MIFSWLLCWCLGFLILQSFFLSVLIIFLTSIFHNQSKINWNFIPVIKGHFFQLSSELFHCLPSDLFDWWSLLLHFHMEGTWRFYELDYVLTSSMILAENMCHHYHHPESHRNLTSTILFSYRQTSWLLDSWVWDWSLGTDWGSGVPIRASGI